MGTAVKTFSLEEYLSDPACERCEYVNGQTIELTGGDIAHARALGKTARMLDKHLRPAVADYVAIRLRCRLVVGGQARVCLPDVAVVLGDEEPEEIRFLNRAPDLVVEVRSPDDSLSALHRKVADYFANGARLAWVILPEERAVLVFAPNAPTRAAISGEVLDGGDLLPDLQIPVDMLFT